FWMSIAIASSATAQRVSLEVRQLRGRNIQFWQIEPAASPYISRAFRALPFTESRSGLAFENLQTQDGRALIIGRLHGESVVKPQVVLQATPSLEAHFTDSDRLGGLLFGGMLGLAVFGAIVSILNRDKTFFLLSALLVTSLRVAGFNYGWDLKWIGWSVEPSQVPIIKNGTLLLHLFLTAALFEELFSK